jgi:hypothetical protein
MVADGAAGGRPVLIALQVRRFRCLEPSCPVVTFAEQADGVSVRYRRRSLPLLAMLAGFGLELAGRAAAQVAGTIGIAVHPATVLRLVAATPDPQVTAAPEVLGVDLSGVPQGPSATLANVPWAGVLARWRVAICGPTTTYATSQWCLSSLRCLL